MSTKLWSTSRTPTSRFVLSLILSTMTRDDHYSVAASPDGLLIEDPIFRPAITRFVRWDDIQDARIVQTGGSSHLRLRLADGSSVEVGSTERRSHDEWD